MREGGELSPSGNLGLELSICKHLRALGLIKSAFRRRIFPWPPTNGGPWGKKGEAFPKVSRNIRVSCFTEKIGKKREPRGSGSRD